MDITEYATFRYDTVEVENALTGVQKEPPAPSKMAWIKVNIFFILVWLSSDIYRDAIPSIANFSFHLLFYSASTISGAT